MRVVGRGGEPYMRAGCVALGVGDEGGKNRQPHQEHVVQQLQVAIGAFTAIVQGTKAHVLGHFRVVSCFLCHRAGVSLRNLWP